MYAMLSNLISKMAEPLHSRSGKLTFDSQRLSSANYRPNGAIGMMFGLEMSTGRPTPGGQVTRKNLRFIITERYQAFVGEVNPDFAGYLNKDTLIDYFKWTMASGHDSAWVEAFRTAIFDAMMDASKKAHPKGNVSMADTEFHFNFGTQLFEPCCYVEVDFEPDLERNEKEGQSGQYWKTLKAIKLLHAVTDLTR